MNQSSFNISLQESIQVIKDFNIFRSVGVKSVNANGVTEEFKALAQKGKYKDAFLAGLRNFDYDILLKDQSFFQFQIKTNKHEFELRYAFFQSPFVFQSYENYVAEEILRTGSVETLEDLGEYYQMEYQQFMEEQELVENYTTIRYDFEYNGYRPLIHSSSHLHIGYQNNVRIPLNKTISPLQFVLFVLKQVYYPEWKSKTNSDLKYVEGKLKKARTNCLDLTKKLWIEQEKLDLHLI